MSGKVKVNLTMDRKVVEKAKKIGLNISKVSENALKEIIRRIESPNAQNNAQDNNWWGRPDLNRSPERPRLRA